LGLNLEHFHLECKIILIFLLVLLGCCHEEGCNKMCLKNPPQNDLFDLALDIGEVVGSVLPKWNKPIAFIRAEI